MTTEKALEGIARCSDELDKLRPVAYPKRREHMTQRLKIARENENEKVVRATERIMLREESLNTWGRLKTATHRRRSPAASRCSIINDEGHRVTISGAEPFLNAVTHHVDKRYTGATDAPISQGQLASYI